MKLFLSQVNSHSWKGLADINGETFKVTLFPGSATQPWEAVLEVGGWVELSDDSKLIQAILKAYTSWQELEQSTTIPHEQDILEALQKHPELLNEIVKVISGRNDDDRE